MPRYANMPERDDRGRFISDDDTDRRRRGGYDDDPREDGF